MTKSVIKFFFNVQETLQPRRLKVGNELKIKSSQKCNRKGINLQHDDEQILKRIKDSCAIAARKKWVKYGQARNDPVLDPVITTICDYIHMDFIKKISDVDCSNDSYFNSSNYQLVDIPVVHSPENVKDLRKVIDLADNSIGIHDLIFIVNELSYIDYRFAYNITGLVCFEQKRDVISEKQSEEENKEEEKEEEKEKDEEEKKEDQNKLQSLPDQTLYSVLIGTLSPRDLSKTISVTYETENINDDDFQDIFQNFGKIIRFFISKDKSTEKSNGIALITFNDKFSATKAVKHFEIFKHLEIIKTVKLIESTIDSNCICLYCIRPEKSTERFSPLLDVLNRNNEISTIRVTHLASNVENVAIRGLFQRFGKIVKVFLVRDDDGLSKGKAFVTFKNQKDAGEAIRKIRGFTFFDKILHVAWEMPSFERIKLQSLQSKGNNIENSYQSSQIKSRSNADLKSGLISSVKLRVTVIKKRRQANDRIYDF